MCKIKNLLLTTILFFFIIASLELLLRYVYTPEGTQLRIEINNIQKNTLINETKKDIRGLINKEQFKFKPLSKGIISHNEYKFETQHDKIGYRNPCFNFEISSNVIFIGDSFLYGIGVADKDLITCGLNNSIYNFYSISLPGAGPNHYYKMLKKNYSNIASKININTNKVDIFFFTGNDFEQLLNFDKVVKDNIYVSDTSKKIIKFINEKIFKSKLFLNSYFFQTLKIILIKKLEINQKGNYFINYAGSTFYEKKTESDEKNFKIKMSKALLRFINLFDELSIKINNLYLIPDPAELDLARFERDLMISSFSENNIDLNFKFKVLKYSCLKVKINCYDFRDILTVDDYYKIDNHLKKSGTEKIVNFIKNLYNG